MVFLLLAALVVVNAGFLWHLERKDRRFDAAVAALCQRLQAPEMAVMEHAQQALPPDGTSYPLTDSEIAEEQRMLIAEIERVENEGLGLPT